MRSVRGCEWATICYSYQLHDSCHDMKSFLFFSIILTDLNYLTDLTVSVFAQGQGQGQGQG